MGGRGGNSGITAKGPQAPPPAPKGPTKASEAKDFAELKAFMQSTHGVNLRSGLAQQDFGTIQKGCETIERLTKELPKLGKFAYSLGNHENGAGVYAHADAWGTVQVNPAYFNDRATLTRAAAHDERTGWHPKGTDADSVIAHELGHLVDAKMSRLQGALPFSASRSVVDEAYSNLKIAGIAKGGIRQYVKTMARYPGDYKDARTFRIETFAEAVSDYLANGSNAHPMSKEVWRIIKREVG